MSVKFRNKPAVFPPILSGFPARLKSGKGFTPLHPESPVFQSRNELQTKVKSSEKPRSLRQGVTGFTFLELVIVVVILGIIFAVSVPRFQGFYRDARVKKAAQNIVTLSRLLREKAILEQAVYSLNFDSAKAKFIVSCNKNNAEKEDTSRAVRLSLSGQGLAAREIDVSVSTGDWPLRFYPDGKMDEAAIELSVKGMQNSTVINSSPRGLILAD